MKKKAQMSVNKNRCVVRTRKKNFEKSIKFSRFAGSFQEISSLGSASFTLRWFQLAHIFVVWASCFIPLLGRTRSRGRCWAAIRVSHRPELSGRASMKRSLDWTLEDNMVEGLFFCATLPGRRETIPPFVQAGAESSDTCALVCIHVKVCS